MKETDALIGGKAANYRKRIYFREGQHFSASLFMEMQL